MDSVQLTVYYNAPDIVAAKAATTYSDPFNGTTNPKAIPGGVVEYLITVTNQGPGRPDNNSVVVTEAVPTNTALFVGDLGGPGSGPVEFTDGSPTSGLTYTFTSLSSTTDDIAFSNNGGSTFTYVPTPDGDGYDSNVTHFQVTPQGIFNGSGGGDPDFQLTFRVRVE